MNITYHVANNSHLKYSHTICNLIYESAQARGTGIAERSPKYIEERINSGKAIIALDNETLVGFSYIETWGHDNFVANSGLIVHPEYRGKGIARNIKQHIFHLSRKLYPKAKIFSITTGLAVMKMNSELGFKPVTFSELTSDKEFWKGCQGCKNFHILRSNEYKMCLCTGLLFDPKDQMKKNNQKVFAKKIVKPIVKIKKSTKYKK